MKHVMNIFSSFVSERSSIIIDYNPYPPNKRPEIVTFSKFIKSRNENMNPYGTFERYIIILFIPMVTKFLSFDQLCYFCQKSSHKIFLYVNLNETSWWFHGIKWPINNNNFNLFYNIRWEKIFFGPISKIYF